MIASASRPPHRRAARAAGFSCAMLLVVTASAAHAGDVAPSRAPGIESLANALTGASKSEYEASRARYAQGDYLGALAHTQRAYEQSHDPRLFWNMAACEKKLRHYRRVVVLLRRLLSEGRTVLSTDDERRARALLEQARGFTADVTIVVDSPGATVLLDGEELGVSPLAEVAPVDAGPHTVNVRKEGSRDAERTFSAAAGTALRIEIVLQREPQSAAPAPVAAAPEEPRARDAAAAPKPRSVVVPWAVAGAGAVSLGVGAYFGVMALGHAEDSDPERFSSAAWASNIFIGVGVVAVATGLYLALRPSSGAAVPPSGPSISLAPSASPHGAGAALRGVF